MSQALAPPTATEWQALLPWLVPRREHTTLGGIVLADGLFLDFALDLPTGIRAITADDLAAAAISEADALEAARRNLMSRSRDPWTRLAPGLFQSPWADFFDGARLALPTLFARIGVRGDPIITIPNRNAVLVTGSEEPDGLRALYPFTRVLANEEHPVHLGGLRLVDGAWRPLGGGDIPLLRHAHSILFLGSLQEALDYQAVGMQARAVIASHGYTVEALHVMEHEGVQMTVANIPRLPRLVIPRTDMVMCADDAIFGWHKLEAMLGKNLVQLDIWPPHYEVRRLPTLVEIAAAKLE